MQAPETKKLQTEDTGKLFEKAICDALHIDYDGNYKYSREAAAELAKRLTSLKDYVPADLRHSARRGSRYDFTSVSDETKHISAKSTKRGCGKVAPQIIGQPQPKKFCELIGIPYTESDYGSIKQHIQTQIVSILPHLVDHTFDCPNLYYNQDKSSLQYIVLVTPIDWNTYAYSWTCPYETWTNSSTLKIKHNGQDVSLVEFQFHSKSRTNMAIRWFYENFLHVFRDHLRIVNFA
jgi:hypothetical protein